MGKSDMHLSCNPYIMENPWKLSNEILHLEQNSRFTPNTAFQDAMIDDQDEAMQLGTDKQDGFLSTTSTIMTVLRLFMQHKLLITLGVYLAD